jgi:hypothetical protein
MKNLMFCLLLICAGINLPAQASLKVEVSADTIRAGEFVEVTYTIENGEGRFVPPDLTGLPLISGPNTSSSFMISNGKRTSSQSFAYIFRPQESKSFTIPAARYIEKDKEMDMESVKIIVEDDASASVVKNKSQPVMTATREKRKF